MVFWSLPLSLYSQEWTITRTYSFAFDRVALSYNYKYKRVVRFSLIPLIVWYKFIEGISMCPFQLFVTWFCRLVLVRLGCSQWVSIFCSIYSSVAEVFFALSQYFHGRDVISMSNINISYFSFKPYPIVITRTITHTVYAKSTTWCINYSCFCTPHKNWYCNVSSTFYLIFLFAVVLLSDDNKKIIVMCSIIIIEFMFIGTKHFISIKTIYFCYKGYFYIELAVVLPHFYAVLCTNSQ